MVNARKHQVDCPYTRPFEHAADCTCYGCAARASASIAAGFLIAAIVAAALWFLS